MTLLKKQGHFRSFWQLIKNYLYEAYFPSFCVNCRTETDLANQFICRQCLSLIELLKFSACPKCNRLNKNGKYCSGCKNKSSLTGIIVAAKYDGPVRELIHHLKYSKMQSISELLGAMICQKLSRIKLTGQLLLVPVPLHPKRQLSRGFNQSELLAKVIHKKLKIPFALALKRRKNTPQQMKLKRSLRLKNLEDAFQCSRPNEIIGKTVLLVDDVSTTGSTLNECAQVLRSAGAKQVFGVVVAKG